jgi:hydroxymethylbilane synthase
MRLLRVGTRGSQLALWQARAVAQMLERHGVAVELAIIKTSGDRLQDAPLDKAGGKRLFVKEIEDALLGGEIDMAVHSAKDMPAILPEGLTIAGVLPREDPRDALVLPDSRVAGSLADAVAAMGGNPTIGTGSVRRTAQLATLVPRARFGGIRGNVDTRLRKLDAGAFDALVLASAGLKRLGFGARISVSIPPRECVPAPGQGIVAIEARADDRAVLDVVKPVSDRAAAQSLDAERALVAALGGGCQLPLGAVALHEADALDMHAIVASLDGRHVVKRRSRGPAAEAAALGQRLAEDLAQGGALVILDAVRGAQAPLEGSD